MKPMLLNINELPFTNFETPDFISVVKEQENPIQTLTHKITGDVHKRYMRPDDKYKWVSPFYLNNAEKAK